MTGGGATPPPAGARPAVQVQVLVDARALERPLDYLVPASMAGLVGPGSLVACPLGPRRVVGVVVGEGPATHRGTLVPLAGVVEAAPLPAALLELAHWVSRYYAAPLPACLRLVLPPGAEGVLRRRADGAWRLSAPPTGPAPRLVARPGPTAAGATGRQAAVVAALGPGPMPAADLVRAASTTMPTLRRMAEAGRLTLDAEVPGGPDVHALGGAAPPGPPPEPTLEQAAAVGRVAAMLDAAEGGALLLHGVTGSGKTEVYLRCIEHARALGRGAIVLVPEISLTPQLLARLRGRLGPGVEVWHSAMSPGERAAVDGRLRGGASDVVIGARSAVFAPLADPGLIVVDEEHDGSYKQDSTPRYDARQVAYRRARDARAVVVYGTATPRPETWRALERVTLSTRVDGSAPPRVTLVDMRNQRSAPVSAPLARALRDAADRGEKAVLLLNRRGFALMALCRACGWLAACPDCDTSMVQHLGPPRLVCHHCGREAGVPRVCPRCGAAEVMRGGVGTQGLEEALRRIVPRARLVRMDASSTAGRGAVARLLADFARPGAAVLLGTQMVAKGHDMPDVTVAAVLDADAGLRYPDFRSEERAFDLIVQAAGRAGRRGERATVIVQAWEPAARAVRLGGALAVEEFLDGELERRARHGFPPFGHLVRVVVEGEREGPVVDAARRVVEVVGETAPDVRTLGPALLHRLRGRTRRAVLLRADRAATATAAAVHAVEVVRPLLDGGGARATIDVDPQSV